MDRTSSRMPYHESAPNESTYTEPITSPHDRNANGRPRMPPPTMVLSRLAAPASSEDLPAVALAASGLPRDSSSSDSSAACRVVVSSDSDMIAKQTARLRRWNS
eukprot:3446182-Prymnesium_polylepis.1